MILMLSGCLRPLELCFLPWSHKEHANNENYTAHTVDYRLNVAIDNDQHKKVRTGAFVRLGVSICNAQSKPANGGLCLWHGLLS